MEIIQSKPEIKIPTDHEKFDIENLKLMVKNNNPKIEAVNFRIKSIENEINSLKRKKIAFSKA